ncbi:MAG TPA: hypothetical protein VGC72_10630 [Candidatus Elarobacter sp.]
MRRLEPVIVMLFAIVALLWGFGAAALAGANGWDPVAGAVSTVVPIALFGWLRRGREIIHVAAPSFVVSYCAYVGVAIVRLAQFDRVPAHFGMDLLDHRWPPVLMAGIAFALIMTVFVAVPASWLQRSRHVENERDARFWSIVADTNAARGKSAQPPPR